MRKKIFTFLLALAASVGMSWATTTDLASITDNYTAQDGEILTGTLGVNVKISIADGATVTLLNANINGDKTWTTGEYAGLTCLGNATITIVGKNYVSGFYVDELGNGYPGIYVPSGKTLIINGTGSLTAQSSTEEAAGIGARKNLSCGNIVIQSGKITAIASGEYGAGIGGAYNASCGDITISGGIVTAVGGDHCAGIGGGRRGANTNAGHCGNILISGGVVSATSGEQAAAIGGGRGNNNNYKTNCGTITITNTALKVYADQGGSSTNTIGAAKYGNCGAVTIGGSTGVINTDPYTYRTKEDGEIVVDYINAIGTVVYTQECKDKIDIARELYDALEDSQIDLVINYQTLLDAEAAYAALIPQPVLVTTHTLQLVADPTKGSVAVTNLLGSGIVDNGDGTYDVPEGAEVTIQATPNEGYEFTGWKAGSVDCDFTDCGNALSTVDNPLTFDMNNEVAFMAEFAAVAPQPQPQIGPKEVLDLGTTGCVGEHYQLTGGGTNIYRTVGGVDNKTITIESLHGEIIDNISLKLYYYNVWTGYSVAASSGDVSSWNYDAYEDLVITNINATSVTLSRVGSGQENGYVMFEKVTINNSDEPQPQPAENVNITPNVDPDHAGVYYSTFFDSANKYALPAGVEAYVADLSGANLLLTKIAEAGEVIPANVAVILKSTVTPFTLTVSDADAVTFTATNDLQGSDTQIGTPANCYVLAGNDGVGFYHYTASMLNPHKAYVIYSGSQAPRRMPFIFDQATGVESVQPSAISSQKVIENGQLFIIKNGVKYNAQGQVVK